MKLLKLMTMSTVTIYLVGCSLCSQPTKTVIAEVEPFKFVPIEVNLSEVKEVKKINLDGKLWFENESNLSVCMGVDTWTEVRRAKSEKDVECKRLGLQNLMLKKANEGNLKQIKRYQKSFNDQNLQ